MTIFFKSRGKSHDSEICEPNLNLLAHAQCIELDIGSRCGGHGVCGGDRIRIPEESRKYFSPPSPEERHHLSDEELAQGWRLACQCFPDHEDLTLEISADSGLIR